MKKARNRFINNLPYLFLVGVIALGLMTIVGTGGGGGGGGDTDTPSAGGEIIQLNVVMGPIVGANVFVYPLDNRDLEIASGITEDSEDINEAGRISLEIPPEYSDTPLLLRVIGGVDIDANDDGVRDAEPTDNDITLEFAIPTAAELEGIRVVANPLLLYASDYIFRNISWDQSIYSSNLPEDYDPATDPEAVRTILRRVAKALLKGDINDDGIINWQDIVSFHPLTDQEKCRIPWDYILDEIERRRKDYFAKLVLHYAHTFYLDPGSLEPFDWNSDGDWRDDLIDERDSSFVLQFSTDKNGYTNQDLFEGQGIRGGKVIFPDNTKISYYWGYPCNGDGVYGSEEDVTEVPLDIRNCSPSDEGYIDAQAGGNITEPKVAPVGEYEIYYKTGDDQEHQENLYVFESTEESLFYAVPEIEVDEEGFIEKFSLRFEDADGNIFEDPPFLWGKLFLQVWNSVSRVNELVREEGYYTGTSPGVPSDIDCYVYQAFINLITPTAPFYPINNGHKIYYEDIVGINLWFIGGDGVLRGQGFGYCMDFYPILEEWNIEAGKITVIYSPSQLMGREVRSIKYRFDSGEWAELDGAILQAQIPTGASKLYVTAKDTTGFYKCPPDELNLE